MATKEAVFSLKVDTGNSVNDIKSFENFEVIENDLFSSQWTTIQAAINERFGTAIVFYINTCLT